MGTLIHRIREKPLLVRSRMTVPLARLARRADPAAEPLRRALRTTLLGQVSAEEREWIARIEARRRELASSEVTTGMPEFDAAPDGSGGRFSMGRPTTSIGFAATIMSLAPQWCVLLMRLVRELCPRSCLELGTGFGISTAYQAAALRLNGSGSLTTLEGSEAWAERAGDGLAALGLEGVGVRVGPIAATLPREAERCAPLDFVFIDAEHQTSATVEHFEAVLPSLSDGAMVVLDDADWPGVREAHAQIGRHQRVSTSVTIGRLGVSVIGAPDRSVAGDGGAAR